MKIFIQENEVENAVYKMAVISPRPLCVDIFWCVWQGVFRDPDEEPEPNSRDRLLVPNIVVVVTDGNSQQKELTFDEARQAKMAGMWVTSLQWRRNERHGVSNHRRLHCLPNCWYRPRSKKTSKSLVTGLCARNSPVSGELPTQKASSAENVSIWWRHHDRSLWMFVCVCVWICAWVYV